MPTLRPSTLHALTLVTLAILLSGCMRSIISDGFGVGSPDGRYRVNVESRGAYAKDYSSRTKKRVYIKISSTTNDATPVFCKKYVYKASGLSWSSQWTSSNQVVVNFVDYGRDVPSYSPLKSVTNHIATVRLIEKEGTFTEDKQ